MKKDSMRIQDTLEQLLLISMKLLLHAVLLLIVDGIAIAIWIIMHEYLNFAITVHSLIHFSSILLILDLCQFLSFDNIALIPWSQPILNLRESLIPWSF